MSERKTRSDLRNVAIIAHVDHGKTTLVDGLLRTCGAFRENEAVEERVMDSGDLERERGITIQSKSTSVEYRGVRIQLVDTPGHADFGGEVERVLGMADAALLLCDAYEGVMPQTRFVLRKALAHGLRPILVVNKIDRPEERAEEVVNEVFDLLVELGADDTQLDFPVVYASAKQGVSSTVYGGEMKDLIPVLDTILEHAPPPSVDEDGPLQFQAVTLGYDSFVGRLVIGRVMRGRMKRGAPVVRVREDGGTDAFRITKLFGTRGIQRVEIEEARAGDIVIVAGVDTIDVGDTVCEPGKAEALPRIAIDPPTIRVHISVNNSPFAGRDGKFVTSRQVGERLDREAMSNISIKVERTDKLDTFAVSGRGELQLAVLIETLRREGYEFAVSRPEIIVQVIDGERCEPVEEVVVDVPETAAGSVMEKLAQRKGRMDSMEHNGARVQMRFIVPSRGLFGYRGEFLTDTRGEGILYRSVEGFEPYAGDLPGRGVGALVCTDNGRTTPHAIFKIQERATLFVPPGVDVYEGQVVGESRRPGDLNVNLTKAKKLDNMRASGRDENVIITPHHRLSIEEALGWIEDDELLEVTPVELRLRKRVLSGSFRKR
ncbi:MAG: translational GTPase TypA [Spirochaetaceae bacterium]|nr:translational GTPase TypA [Myxococcales bacterium]MCB9724600.1 translational GTPase TypA [Spirochaetaceae bacterium]HPG26596.1 translational GTPase TypA [Myxococcota bacterium]